MITPKKVTMIEQSIKDLLHSIDQRLGHFMSKRDQDDFIPYEKAMELLDCSRQTLDRLRSDKLLPVYKIRGKGRLYVKRSELMQLMELDEFHGESKPSDKDSLREAKAMSY